MQYAYQITVVIFGILCFLVGVHIETKGDDIHAVPVIETQE